MDQQDKPHLNLTAAAQSVKQAFVAALKPLFETGELSVRETVATRSEIVKGTNGMLWWKRAVDIPVTITDCTTHFTGAAGSINVNYSETRGEKYVSQALDVTLPRADADDLAATLTNAMKAFSEDERGFMYFNDGPHLAPIPYSIVDIKEEADKTTLRFNPVFVWQNGNRDWLYSWRYGVNFLQKTLTEKIEDLMLRRYKDEHKPPAPPQP